MAQGPHKPNPISLWLERRRFRRSISPRRSLRARGPRRPGPIARFQAQRDRRRQRSDLRKSTRLGPIARFRARREIRREAPPKPEGPTIRQRIEARTSRDKGPPPPKRRAPLFGGRADRVFAGIVGALVIVGGVAFVLTRDSGGPGIQTGFRVDTPTTTTVSPSPSPSVSRRPSHSPSPSASPTTTRAATTAALPPPPPPTTTTVPTTVTTTTTTTKPPTTTTTTTTTKPPGGGCTIPIQCTTQSHAPAAVTAGPSTNAIAIGVALLALLLGASIAARARHPA